MSPQTYYKRRHDALPPSLKGCLSKDAPLAVPVWAFGGEGCLSERGSRGGGRQDGGSIIPRKSSLLLSFPAAHAAPETAVGSQKSSSLVRSPTFSSLGSGAVKFYPFHSCLSACLMRSRVSSSEFHRHSSPVNTSFSMLHAVGHTRATSLTHSYGRRDLQRGGGAPRPLRDSGGGEGDATALRRTHGDPQ